MEPITPANRVIHHLLDITTQSFEFDKFILKTSRTIERRFSA
jgi:hypothetical protein